MELIDNLRFYLHQDDPRENLRISSKYEWEILEYLPGSYLPRFTAKRKDSEKRYYCQLMNKDYNIRYLLIYEECKKYKSIVSLDDQVTINNITCVFYEIGDIIKNPIDEKKLIEMFIELNDINLAGSRNLPESKIMIHYYIDEIIFKDDRYQIYPSSAYEKQGNKDEYSLAMDVFMVFKLFKLSLTDKIEEIKSVIKEKEFPIETIEKHLKYLAENNLNKRLSALI